MNYKDTYYKLTLILIMALTCAFMFKVYLDKTKAELNLERETSDKVIEQMTRQNDLIEAGIRVGEIEKQ